MFDGYGTSSGPDANFSADTKLTTRYLWDQIRSEGPDIAELEDVPSEGMLSR